MRIGLTGLLKIELPTHTIRLSDGGYSIMDGETFTSDDPVFGTIAALQPLVEGFGDSVPSLALTLLPPTASTVSQLARPGFQTSRARFWTAEYDLQTGAVTSAHLQFDGQIDRVGVSVTGRARTVEVSIVSLAERLFEGNLGNTMNPNFHKSVWPGETGHDQATGLSVAVAWGTGSSSSGLRGGDGGGGYTDPQRNRVREFFGA